MAFQSLQSELSRRLRLGKMLPFHRDIFLANWHLGFTSFGGPNVHFQIFLKKFVAELKWIDDQLYQELFALCQTTPGPGSTKMLFCINYVRGGFLSAILGFFFWSLPGAIGMYGLSLGIHQVSEILPSAAYAFISGLNAATVGIIALAAVQLSDKAITDKLTRVIVFLGACAGMLYSTLWYYPVLLAAAGAFTVVWDQRWLHKAFIAAKHTIEPQRTQEYSQREADIELQPPSVVQYEAVGAVAPSAEMAKVHAQETLESSTSRGQACTSEHVEERRIPATRAIKALSWKQGLLILAFFLVVLVVVLVLRNTLQDPPFPLALYSNFFLAGTLIFGGGPVVTPLLSQYVVQPGWVSTRDFLLGLAIINAFPGPNFNFAVYLGSLAALGAAARDGGAVPSYAGALLAYFGIFVPGLAAISGLMGIWSYLRSKPWLKSVLRGVNALAVGLVFTAVYKLWQVGVLDKQNMGRGSPIGSDPWWVVITATSFVGGRWFGVNAVSAIILGGVMGLVWYGVTQA